MWESKILHEISQPVHVNMCIIANANTYVQTKTDFSYDNISTSMRLSFSFI